MVDLHLVSWNRPKMTELVIRTIHKNTEPGTFTLEVVDNGSNEETTTMLHRLHKEGLIPIIQFLDKNAGLEWARQYLLTKETYNDYFVDIDNDCLPPPNWLPNMVDLMDKYEDYAAISQRTQVMIGTGNIFEDETKELTDFPHPGGSFRIMRTSAVNEVGGWGRETPGRGSEERLIGGKLNAAGYKTAFATRIPCLHLFGTRGDNGTDRWGYDKDMKPEDSGHSDVWHPVLGEGDDPEMVVKFAGEELTKEYFNADSTHQT